MDRDAWNQRYAAQPLLFDIDPDPLLSREVGHLAPGRALDLGAGEGRATLWLAARGWHVTAVDQSDVAINRGRNIALKQGLSPTAIDWRRMDLGDYVIRPDSLELALLLFVHPPGVQRKQLLRDLVAALSPEGTILVVGYDTSHATMGKGGPREPGLLFSPDDIVSDLPGMRIDRAERIQVGDAIDTIVRATKASASTNNAA